MNRALLLLLATTTFFVSSACKRGTPPKHDERSNATLPSLAASSPTLTIPVNGFGEAVVAVPLGATKAKPIVVAVLGIGDTPEDQCTTWKDIVGARAFVLCPRGAKNMVSDEPEGGAAPAPTTPSSPTTEGEGESEGDPPESENDEAPVVVRPDGGRTHQVGYYPIDLPTLEREVTAGLAALKARFGAHVAEGNVVYAGFSRGAFLGASLVAKQPGLFHRAILIEGGQSAWQTATASAFTRGGGERVLFACGQPPCIDEAEQAASVLRAQKAEVRVVHGVGEGHGYRKQVKDELRRSFDWLVEGDPLWR